VIFRPTLYFAINIFFTEVDSPAFVILLFIIGFRTFGLLALQHPMALRENIIPAETTESYTSAFLSAKIGNSGHNLVHL